MELVYSQKGLLVNPPLQVIETAARYEANIIAQFFGQLAFVAVLFSTLNLFRLR